MIFSVALFFNTNLLNNRDVDLASLIETNIANAEDMDLDKCTRWTSGVCVVRHSSGGLYVNTNCDMDEWYTASNCI